MTVESTLLEVCMGKYISGLLIGMLCGLVPLLFCLISRHKALGIVGGSMTAVSGVIFVLLDKSPFTAIAIAAIFSIFNIARCNKGKYRQDDADEDIYFD